MKKFLYFKTLYDVKICNKVVLLTARKVIFTASQVFCEAVKDYQLCFKTAIILIFKLRQMLFASIFTNVAFCFGIIFFPRSK